MGRMDTIHAPVIDGRLKPHYSASVMLKKTLSMFFFQFRSINAYVEADTVNGRYDDPVQNTYAYYVEHAGVCALNIALWDQVHVAMRLKQLDHLRSKDGRWTMAFDGVSSAYSEKRCCEKCLKTTKDSVVSYHHGLLVASIVDKVSKTSIVVAVIPIENTAVNTNKQACELTAATMMLDHLRKMCPHLRYHITVDGLYLSAGFIDQAVRYGHSVTMPLAKENMTIHKVLDVRLGNNRPTVRLDTKTETTSVVYDPEDIAEFWPALHELNPSIALHGMKRTIINKATGERRECPIVTTLVPSEKNAMAISDIQREKWQEENQTFNELQNHHHLKHIFNHKAQTQVFMFAALALNMRTIYLLRHPPQPSVQKPLTLTSLVAAIFSVCSFDPLALFITDPLTATD